MSSLVTVVIPVYNYGHYLPDALDSICIQTYPQWECLVVDDGSVDDTRKISEHYLSRDDRFSYIYQENRGLSAARNTGIRHARSDYVQFLDADDVLDPGKLAAQVTYLDQNPDIDIVYGDWGYFDETVPGLVPHAVMPPRAPWTPRVSGRGLEIMPALLRDNILVVSAALARKSLLVQTGGFDETLSSHEDWDLWLRAALVGGSFSYLGLGGTKTHIRLHGDNMSSNAVTMHESNLAVRKKIQSILHEASLRAVNRKGIREISVLLAVEKLKRGYIGSGAMLFLRSCFSKAGLAMICRLTAARIRVLQG